MARGRMLNKTVCASLKFNELSDDTNRLTATWIISHLDCRGVFYGDPAMVKSFVFPRRADVTVDQVESCLKDMERVGLIFRFHANGDLWQCWPGFADNQVGLRADRESTDYPAPPAQHAGTKPEPSRNGSGGHPAEEKGREDQGKEKRKEYANADAPASEPTPTTFQGWHELVTTSKNPNATLRYMHETLFPGRAPPDFGYIGRTANNVGGPGRLADLMWQAVPRAPTGDVMRYCMGIARSDREPEKPPEPAGYAGIREFLEEKGVIDGNGIRNREHPRLPGGDVPKIPTDKGHGKSIRDGPG